jgi:hypothetical protein
MIKLDTPFMTQLSLRLMVSTSPLIITVAAALVRMASPFSLLTAHPRLHPQAHLAAHWDMGSVLVLQGWMVDGLA